MTTRVKQPISTPLRRLITGNFPRDAKTPHPRRLNEIIEEWPPVGRDLEFEAGRSDSDLIFSPGTGIWPKPVSEAVCIGTSLTPSFLRAGSFEIPSSRTNISVCWVNVCANCQAFILDHHLLAIQK